MNRLHLILTGLSLTIILLSLNRLTDLTLSYLQPFEFLRWLDFNAMILIPFLSIILYYLLRGQIIYESNFHKTYLYGFLGILFVAGVYLFGVGSGDHEVTNYLNTRFCERGKIDSPLCNIIKYNDDQFSHLIYYLGFILLNVSLMLLEYNYPRKERVKNRDLILISLNSLFIALGIFANLAFEEIGLDLFFFGSVMLLSLYLLFFTKYKYYHLPATFYFGVSYSIGVLSTLIYKFI